MSHWICCCGGDACCRRTDAFSTDSTEDNDLGENWEVLSGRWRVVDGVLHAYEPGEIKFLNPCSLWAFINSIDLLDVEHADNEWYLWWRCKDNSDEGSARLLCYLEPSIGLFFRLTVGTESIESVGQKPTTTLTNCVGPDHHNGYALGFIYPLWECKDLCEMDCGIGAGALSSEVESLQFDNWSHSEHYYTDHTCPSCYCTCQGWCLEKTLTGTLVDGRGCANIDGTVLSFTENGSCKWTSEDWNCGLGKPTVWFELARLTGTNDTTIDQFVLTMNTATTYTTHYPDQELSTCHPLRLVFTDLLRPGDGSYSAVNCCEGYTDPSCPDIDPNPMIEYRWCQGYFTLEITK